MSEEDEKQERVINLVSQINAVLAGVDLAESATALTLAVMCQIVATSKDNAECKSQARFFTKQVFEYADRRDIVDWIRASTFWPPAGGGGKQ